MESYIVMRTVFILFSFCYVGQVQAIFFFYITFYKLQMICHIYFTKGTDLYNYGR